ncbi:myosin heavy chain, skeletal muscle-like [Oryzias melastigma]|uniref:myosin heavy chain, skeletal muscle-like n=1 Tax=Oryzias melastigma TaxID=30732 RepID=UPI000CF7C6F8|nr:myosin heavy chain, skeletal muscle-like [Oryzias melastigma]
MESQRRNSEISQEMAQMRKNCEEMYASFDKTENDLSKKFEQVTELVELQRKLVAVANEMQEQQEMEILDLTCKIIQLAKSLKQEKTKAENERKEWERQKFDLSQEMAQMRKDHEKRTATFDKAEREFSEKFGRVEKQMEHLQETITEKVTIINYLEGTLMKKFDQQNQLAMELLLERKNSELYLEMAQMRKDHEQRSATLDRAEKEFSEKFVQVKMQMEQLQETIKENVTIINNFNGVLKELLDQQKQQDKLQKQHQMEMSDLTSKISELESSLKEEKTKASEEETRLAKQVKELAQIKAVLVDTERNLQQQNQQLQKEKNRLINEHQLALSKEKKLAMERKAWERKNSELSQKVKKDHEERSATFDKAEKDFSEKFAQVKKQLEQLQETIVEKVTIRNNLDGVLEEKLDQQKQQMDKQHQMEMSDLTGKISKLENSLKEEKTRANEAETRLAQQLKESAQLKAMFVDAERNLQEEKKELEKEKNCLINEHQLALSKEKKQFAKERKEWERRISELSHEMAQMKKGHEERSATFVKAERDFSERFVQVEKHMEQLKEAVAEKVTIVNSFGSAMNEKLDLQKTHQREMSDLTSKISKLENSDHKKKTRANEPENRFAQRVKELVQQRAMLRATEQKIQQQRWQNSVHSQEMAQMRKSHEEKSATFDKAEKDFSENFVQVEKQMEQQQETTAEKVNKIKNSCVLEEKLDLQKQQMDKHQKPHQEEMSDHTSKISKLENSNNKDKTRANEPENRFAQCVKELVQQRPMLRATERKIQQQRWQNSVHSQVMAQMRKSHEKKSATFDKAEKDFSEKLVQVEKQMEQQQETTAEKVTKIKCSNGVLKEKLDQQKQQMDKHQKPHQMEMSDLTSKISELENPDNNEKTTANEAENRIAQRVKELVQKKAFLDYYERNLQQSRQHNSEHSQEMSQMGKSHEERSATFDKTEKNFSKTFVQVEKQMEQQQETTSEKVTKIKNSNGVLEEKLDQQKQQVDKHLKPHQMEMSDLTSKMSELENPDNKQKTRAKEAENRFAQRVKELVQQRSLLVDSKRNLQQQKK